MSDPLDRLLKAVLTEGPLSLGWWESGDQLVQGEFVPDGHENWIRLTITTHENECVLSIRPHEIGGFIEWIQGLDLED